MEDFELFPDEEEEAEEEEGGTNRLFIFLVAGFGIVLLLGICAFGAWAFVFYPAMQNREAQNKLTEGNGTAAAMAAEVLCARYFSRRSPPSLPRRSCSTAC